MSTDTGSSMSEGNIALPDSQIAGESASKAEMKPAGSRALHMVIDDELLSVLKDRIPGEYKIYPRSSLDGSMLLDDLSSGGNLVWIGNPEGIPQDIWVGSFRPADTELALSVSDNSPLAMDGFHSKSALCSSAYIKPVKEMLLHNVDEEVRADLLPILEAKDRFGEVVGYPCVLMNYYAPSLGRGRFGGSQCFFFLFDEPVKVFTLDEWAGLLRDLADRFVSAVQIRRVTTDYASYRTGERVRVRARVGNLRENAASVKIRFSLKGPDGAEFKHLVTHRRCPNGNGESEAICDFPILGAPGLWNIRVEVLQDIRIAEELAEEGEPQLVDSRDIGFVLFDGPVTTPKIMDVDGPAIVIDGRKDFWTGTHYYPSSSWWEWVWRDFRSINAARDFKGIRRTGYRIVRIWIDPVLDEETLRAMDACIYLAAQEGVVLDVCVFTQWVKEIGFERPNGEQVRWDFRSSVHGNVYSISFMHMDLQREYIQILAKRWKNALSIAYNLSNETYVKDPDASQMDPEVANWEGIPGEYSDLRNSLLFRRWANEITAAIRDAGGNQPVVPSYMFTLSQGGDSYLSNRDGDIASWHCYAPGLNGMTVTYFDPVCSNRPLIVEEFGALGWNAAKDYDSNVHYSLAAGASAAMSYEWGISWLSPDMCFYPVPLRDGVKLPEDPRNFQPYVEAHKAWPSRSVGICGTPSGFGYGSIYHGTPFPAEAAVALGRLGLMGRGLGRALSEESTYLLIPMAKNDNMDVTFNATTELWRQKAVFGVWQEDCLPSIPKSVKVIICPDGVRTPEAEKYLEELAKSGVKVFMAGDEGWKDCPEITRLAVEPADDTRLLTRRTVEGTLYTLVNEEQSLDSISIVTEGGFTVKSGLRNYVMIHERSSGIGMIEAAGDLYINGELFCSISNGRAIIASNDNSDLLNAKSLRVMVTEPVNITFSRPVKSWSIEVESENPPAISPEFDASGNALDIDSEMVKYVLNLKMQG